MDKCKNCSSVNLVECNLVVTNPLRIRNPKRKVHSKVLCLACSDCGEVNRIYAADPEKIQDKDNKY